MYKENLRYKKIKDFIETLNDREINYIYKKLQQNILEKQVGIVEFTVNGQTIK